ncbi:MAG: Carboxy-terminal processing protease CtpA precursor [Candidatus Hydrogenedentes bacterium ADurb.Bin101]|jgi:carboxyl-terminal processing protease|nr:S41 family peptidase [Candidatus Hydrogenedentota bacterium]OQC05042.1 MAG: Carboxy-terminal processing protease CtpA precursor [Candidatus Hydrogenedentes bacterium ADurb.Bin101]HOC70584.1 S41 family peptidase [Candidatus Hydrogenedentota bacterium]
MSSKNSKREFFVVLGFCAVVVLALTNGFVLRIYAQEQRVEIYREIEPIGDVIDIILREYVRDVDIKEVVEGALGGMMGSLDRNSAYVSAEELEALREETKGEFEGIGVSIKQDEEGKLMVFMPILGSPAAKAGILPYDLILAIDGKSTEDMDTSDAADLIRGRRGTFVTLTLLREPGPDGAEGAEAEPFEVKVERARIPLESIKESQMLLHEVGYIRLNSFSDTTSKDLEKYINELLTQGMKTLVLDLRWNSGGLLSASKEVCELFLPKDSLVTYTRGREREDGSPNKDDMLLRTEKNPILPQDLPIVILVNEETASAAEIVTGALQYYQRAIVLGEKTFGKGSVQTIIPLQRPPDSGLRLTTALYYTPADVTIDHQGILPDVEVKMDRDQELDLAKQMYASFERAFENQYHQNHGSMTPGYEVTEETVEDLPLARAVEILTEPVPWEGLINKYHRAIEETQVAAESNTAINPKLDPHNNPVPITNGEGQDDGEQP